MTEVDNWMSFVADLNVVGIPFVRMVSDFKFAGEMLYCEWWIINKRLIMLTFLDLLKAKFSNNPCHARQVSFLISLHSLITSQLIHTQ